MHACGAILWPCTENLDNGMNGYDISKDSMLLLFLYRILIMSLVSLSSAQNKIGMTY